MIIQTGGNFPLADMKPTCSNLFREHVSPFFGFVFSCIIPGALCLDNNANIVVAYVIPQSNNNSNDYVSQIL